MDIIKHNIDVPLYSYALYLKECVKYVKSVIALQKKCYICDSDKTVT
jgi:hypothetical protein